MSKIRIETGIANTTLRTISTPVGKGELSSYGELIQNMLKHIKNPENGGVGLAAPQVGVNKRIIVVSLMRDYEDEQYRTIAMINPIIVEHSPDTYKENEGCLSVPGETGEVVRWKWAKVHFLDPKGTETTLRLTELAARIVQHEIDHLDGVLFVDKVEKKPMFSL